MDRNILLISEKDQKAYLPYKDDEIEKIYSNSNKKYNSIQEIIKERYVLPLDRFQNAPISRFRETIFKAIDLAIELMFNFKLNPIIIAACSNLDELDIYLDCLEENQLFDFKCFEIKFEVTPDIYTKHAKVFYE